MGRVVQQPRPERSRHDVDVDLVVDGDVDGDVGRERFSWSWT
jgi:hypothetical protein